MVPVARLALLQAYPKAELVRITNLVTMPTLLGPAIGPLLGGMLATYVNWRAVFFINVPIGLLGLWATQRALDNRRAAHKPSLDVYAFVLFGAALAGLSFSFECLGDAALSWTTQLTMLGGALLLLSLFAHHTARFGDTFFALSLFHLRTFRLGVYGNCVSRLGVGSVPFLLPLMYQMRFGLTPMQAAVRTLPLPLGMFVVRPGVQRLLHLLGFRRLLVSNTLLLGLTLAALASIGQSTGMWQQSAIVFFYGAFASVHFACMNVLAYVDVDSQRMAGATSIVSTVHTFAMGAGVAFGALLVQLFLPEGAGSGGPAYAFHRTFVVLGALTMLSAVLFRGLDDNDGAAVSGRAARAAKAV